MLCARRSRAASNSASETVFKGHPAGTYRVMWSLSKPRWVRVSKALGRLVAALTVAHSVFSQELLVTTYSVDDGLPSPAVEALAEDDRGQILAAARTGISVYDGWSWNLDTPSDIPGVPASALTRDAAGGVWGYFPTVGVIAVRRQGQWITHAAIPSAQRMPLGTTVFAAVVGDGGEWWAAIGQPRGGLVVGRESVWVRLGAADGFEDEGVRSLIRCQSQVIAATERRILVLSDAGIDAAATAAIPPPPDTPLAVAIPADASDGHHTPDLWLLTRTAVWRLAASGWAPIVEFSPLPHDAELRSVLLPRPDRDLLFGVGDVVYLTDLQDGSRIELDEDAGLLANGANAAIVDHDGNLWIGQTRGVAVLVSRHLAAYRQRHGLLDDEVTAICARPDGSLVFGHNNGLSVLAGGVISRLPFQRPGPGAANRVMDLECWPNGTTWIAATTRGVGRLSARGSLRWTPLPGETITALAAAGGEAMWVGGSRLYRLEHGSAKLIWDPADLGSIRRLLDDGQGGLLVAAGSGGLIRITPDHRATPIPGPAGEATANVYTMFLDSHSRTWVGTRGGLLRLDGDRLVPPPAMLQEIAPVYLIAEDATGALWIGGHTGVDRWDGATVRHFSVHDGLAGREANRDAAALDSYGRLWLGSDRGATVVDPHLDRGPPPPPTIRIDAVRAGTSSLSVETPHTLPSSTDSLQFDFSGQSRRTGDRLHYRYRLRGLSDRWSDPLPAYHRSAVFSGLRPGRYVFELTAATPTGDWAPAVRCAPITIRRPIWTHPAFRIALAVLAGMVLLLAGRTAARWRYLVRVVGEAERRRRAEAALHESEASFRSIVDRSSDGIVLSDSGGVVRFVNPAAMMMLRRRRDDLIGLRVPELVVGAGERVPIATADDTDGRADVRLTPTEWSGQPATLAVLRDVTAQLAREEQLRRREHLAAVGQLAAGVAHDFNNTLQSIMMGAETLRSRYDPATDQVRATAEEMLRQTDRGARLVRQILDFSRRSISSLETIDVSRLVKNLVKMLRRTISETIDIRVELPGSDAVAVADPGRLEQAITNLALNARDAMPDGGIMTISVTPRELGRDDLPTADMAPGSWLHVEVRDTGKGIPDAILPHLFEPFFTTKDAPAGTGLGLAQVYGIVQQHGGHVTVETAEGRGSTFSLYLPASDQQPAPDRRPEPMPPPPATAATRTLLLVDDDPGIRDSTAEALTAIGLRVVVAADGAEALAWFEAHIEDVDLVLSDIVLPGLSGIEIARRLHAARPELPIILMTGYPLGADEGDLPAADAIGWLQKPFRLEELVRTVERALAT